MTGDVDRQQLGARHDDTDPGVTISPLLTSGHTGPGLHVLAVAGVHQGARHAAAVQLPVRPGHKERLEMVLTIDCSQLALTRGIAQPRPWDAVH